MCVFVIVCVCLCVFLHDNSKSNPSRNMKFEYVVVYENISESSIMGIVRSRSRSRWDFEIFLHLPQYKLSVPIT